MLFLHSRKRVHVLGKRKKRSTVCGMNTIARHPIALTLRLLALAVLLTGLGWWLADGARLGWTRTSVEVMHRDEITEIEYPVSRDALVADVEFPVAGVAIAAALFGLSCFF